MKPWQKNLLIAVPLAAAMTVLMLVATTQPIDQAYRDPPPVEPPKPQLVSGQSRLLFTGEVFWGRSYERNRRNNTEDALQFPFSGLNTYNRDDYDAWIGFLECPITDENVPFDEEWNAIRLNCRPEFLPEFAKWYDIVSLAGNHANDVNGTDGYDLTKDYLDQYDIGHFGRLDPDITEDICKVLDVPLRLSYDDGSTETTDMEIAFCGYNGVFQIISQESIDVISQYADRYFTVVMPQTGAEYVPSADNLKTSTYRAMIDAGADLVIGSHPHWVQNSEVYKDKLILYSVGNFIFDQNFSTEVRSSASLDALLDFTSPEQLAYLESLINDSDTNKALPTLKYDLIPGLMTDLLQTKSTDQATIDRILRRTNWADTNRQLNE